MDISGRRILVCDCAGTMRIDGAALARACGSDNAPVIHNALCRAQLDAFEQALDSGRPLIVGCTQEAPLFAALAEAHDKAEENGDADPVVGFVNIRERAGWGDEGAESGPKMAALLAEAAVDISPTPSLPVESAGIVVVLGRDERAMDVGDRLAERLDVTILLDGASEILAPRVVRAPLHRGRVTGAKGHLGSFELQVAGYAAADPASRRVLEFGPEVDATVVAADIVFDITGGAPLFTGGTRRDGYLRADPGDPVAVERALFEAVDLVGSFEKPRYVAYDRSICAHSRNQQIGCTRCLDVCPTGAIAPDGDGVAIDAYVCAGCGQCAATCPTGAASYDLPPTEAMFERLRILMTVFHRAGGRLPVVLVHDGKSDDLVAAIGRHGRGLPAKLLPFPINVATQVGVEFLSVAMAYGAKRVCVLVDRSHPEDRGALDEQVLYFNSIAEGLGHGSEAAAVCDEVDPDLLENRLYDLCSETGDSTGQPASFLALGGKRDRMRMAVDHLHRNAPVPVDRIALPAGAPFGTIALDSEACTLCFACVGVCPPGALGDNPDRPQLTFREDACVQCGLCRITCPENAISLDPRLDFGDQARRRVVIKEEEPALCIRCGTAFGAASSVERIVQKLAEHPTFVGDTRALARIRMCADCRVVDQFSSDAPMAAGPRPRVRTTDDYLAARAADKPLDDT